MTNEKKVKKLVDTGHGISKSQTRRMMDCGGFPRNLTEVFASPEGRGFSDFSIAYMKKNLDAGKTVVYLDVEKGLSPEAIKRLNDGTYFGKCADVDSPSSESQS